MQNSPSIQKALFYLPDKTHRDRVDANGPPMRNSLLLELFPAWFNLKSDAREFPFTPDFANHPPTPQNPGPGSASVATWREMLIQQQPTVKTVGMWWLIGDWEGTLWITAKVFSVVARPSKTQKKEDGLRMADYFDLGIYKSGRKIDHVWVHWPTTSAVVGELSTAETLILDDRSAFLKEVEELIRPEHPFLPEVQIEKRHMAMKADMIFVTPLNPYANLPREANEDGAPCRDNCMMRFLDVDDSGIVEGAHCSFKETYSRSMKLEDGFDVGLWEEEVDDFVGCTMFG